MLTPIVVSAGYFTVDSGNYNTATPIRSIFIENLDNSEQVAALPPFSGYALIEQSPFQPARPGVSTFNSGLYPSSLPDSGSLPGFRRDFEEAVVIVQPANQNASLSLYGRLTRVPDSANGRLLSKVDFFPLQSGSIGGSALYQYVVIKITPKYNAT